MLKKFFALFGGVLALVLILGALFIKLIVGPPTLVEFWMLLMIPSFGIPIITSALLFPHEELL